MQLEKEKKEKRERERCRALAQRIAEEANPASAALLGEQMSLLTKALHRAGVEAEEWTESSEAELLVVADPAWETLPETLPARVLLVSDESTVMAGWAEQLAGQGVWPVFRRKNPLFGELPRLREALRGARFIGITAGASTPACIIKEVQNSMSVLENNTEEMNFGELLDQYSKSIHNGEKVTAVVTGIKPTEISVDAGTKHACYVPLDQLTSDPTAKPEDIVKIGDELELMVVRVNDVEGTAMLSKTRLDAVAGFEKVMNAGETGEVLTGVVTEVIKGGVLVLTNGVKVFIPASQTGIPRDGDLNTLLRKEVSFKILETNRQRRRAVGSISVVAREARKELAQKFWEEVEVGKVYTGKVKSLTNFGAFVDLGGVDGRIGLTDLTWLRVKSPAEVVSIGDTVEVTVKDIDRENNRVSLIYKKTEDNPWEKIKTMYQVGDVVPVKIMSVTTFGAFAQIIPGIDGLIHISQIARERVEKVADKLSVGQVVDAKITELDYDRHRASLSIKALLTEEAPEEESVEEPVEEEAPAEE